jgi:hypothetical protein
MSWAGAALVLCIRKAPRVRVQVQQGFSMKPRRWGGFRPESTALCRGAFNLNSEFRKAIALCKRCGRTGSKHKKQAQLPPKTRLSKIHPLFGSRKVHFRGTPKPMTPFGGRITLVECFGKIRLTNPTQDFMPFGLNRICPRAASLRRVAPDLVCGSPPG